MVQKKIHTRPGHHRQSFKMNRSWYIILDVVRWQTTRRILFFYFTFHPSDSHHPRPLHRSLKQGCNFSISSINSFRIHIDSALLVTWFFFCRGQTNLDGYRANQPSQLVSDAMSTATRTPYLRYHRCDKQPPNLANLTRPLPRVLPQSEKSRPIIHISTS